MTTNDDTKDQPVRERLLDHVPEHATIIEAQIQKTTTAQRIEDARQRGVGREYEPEENIW